MALGATESVGEELNEKAFNFRKKTLDIYEFSMQHTKFSISYYYFFLEKNNTPFSEIFKLFHAAKYFMHVIHYYRQKI